MRDAPLYVQALAWIILIVVALAVVYGLYTTVVPAIVDLIDNVACKHGGCE